MFEFRVYSPTLKTTFFYGREPSFEQAWDKAVVYILNDDRWKDQSNIINAISSTETDPNHESRGSVDVDLGCNKQADSSESKYQVAVTINKTKRGTQLRTMSDLGV